MIPEKVDQAANRKKRGSAGGRPVSHDATLYKDRNTVERCINRLRNWRGIATRFEADVGLEVHASGFEHHAAEITDGLWA